MLRNEDRLYHIVVTFPSICAKQFLIVKIRKNEALYCLIGFGIGISCCLMYRWFKNAFFSIDLSKSHRFVYEHHHYHHYNNENNLLNNVNKSDLNNKNSNFNQFNRKPKAKTKKFKTESLFRSNSLNKQRQTYQHDDLNTKTASDPEIILSSNVTINSSLDNNQISPGLVNFSKVLNKKCFKTFKIRRALNKQKNQLNNNLNLFSKKMTKTEQEPKLILTKSTDSNSNSKSNLLNEIEKEDNSSNLNDNKTGLNYSNNYLNGSIFGDDEIENDYLSLANNKANSNNFNKLPNKFLNDSNYFNYSENNDSADFSRSHRSSACDFDDFPAHNPLNKSVNSVDKSLDEALHHIDKLKEDMSHLCNDIDSLYKTKNLSNINSISSSLKNNSYLFLNKNSQYDRYAFDINTANESFNSNSDTASHQKCNDYLEFDYDEKTVEFLDNLTDITNNENNRVKVKKSCLHKGSQTKICSLMDYSLFSDESDESTTNTTINRKIYSPCSLIQPPALNSDEFSSTSSSSNHLYKKHNSFYYCNLSKKVLFNKKKSPLHR